MAFSSLAKHPPAVPQEFTPKKCWKGAAPSLKWTINNLKHLYGKEETKGSQKPNDALTISHFTDRG